MAEGVTTVIIVPYRHSDYRQARDAQLSAFVQHMPRALDEALGQRTWAVLVIEQSFDGHAFSRGRAINAGVHLARARYPNVINIVQHDVDLLPDVERIKGFAFPPVPKYCIRALNVDSPWYKGMKWFCGGICVTTAETFLAANGFQNGFEGWGGEETEFRNAVRLCADNSDGRHRWFEEFREGSVVDLEWEAKYDAETAGDPAPFRCATSDDVSVKLPKEFRHRVAEAAKANNYATDGFHEFAFAIAGPQTVLGPPVEFITSSTLLCRDSGAGAITLVPVHLFMGPLPPGWTMVMSKSKGIPYYSNASTRVTSWEWPEGTLLTRA